MASAKTQKKSVRNRQRKQPVRKAPVSSGRVGGSPIDARIMQLESDLETLKRARLLLGMFEQRAGASNVGPALGASSRVSGRRAGGMTIAEACSKILAGSSGIHVREILKRLGTDYGISTTEKNLTNTLSRWAQKKKVFTRVGRNVFALLGTS